MSGDCHQWLGYVAREGIEAGAVPCSQNYAFHNHTSFITYHLSTINDYNKKPAQQQAAPVG